MMLPTPDGGRIETLNIDECILEVSSPASIDMTAEQQSKTAEPILIIYFKGHSSRTFTGDCVMDMVSRLRKARVPINLPSRSKVSSAVADAGFRDIKWPNETTINAVGPRHRLKRVIIQCGAFVDLHGEDGEAQSATVFRTITDRRALRE